MTNLKSDKGADYFSGYVPRIQLLLNALSEAARSVGIRPLIAINAAVWALATVTLFRVIAPAVVAQETSNQYWPWIRNYFFPRHKLEILAFAVVVVILGFLAIVTLLQLRNTKQDSEPQKHRLYKLILVGLAAVLLNFYAASTFSLTTAALLCILFPVFIAGPFLPNSLSLRHATSAAKFCTFALLAELIIVCAIFGAGFVPIPSDYLQIPSTVRIRDRVDTILKPVDTISYINENHILGNHRIPDYRTHPNGDMPCEPENRIDLPNGSILQNWIRQNRDTFYISYPEKHFCFIGALSDNHAKKLADLFPEQRTKIATAALASAEVERQFLEQPSSFSDTDFARKIHLQLVNFYHDLETQFHHHFQYLNPIKEHTLGKPLNEILSQYGLGFLVIERVMSLTGGITFQSFIASMFLIQATYVIGFVCLAHWLLRSWPSTLGVTAVLVGSFTGLGVTTILEGFGYGPARHALDLLVIFFFAHYLKSLDSRYLAAAAIAAILNLGLDRFVGAFCACALVAILALRVLTNLTSRPRLEAICGLLLAIATVGGFVALGHSIAENPFAKQIFSGVWGFPVNRPMLLVFFAWLCASLAAAVWSIAYRADQKKSLAVFLIAYALLFAFYWLMLPNYAHLYKMLPYAALATAITWRYCVRDYISPTFSLRVGAVGVILSLLVWAQLSRFLLSTSVEALLYFRGHEIHEWNFARFQAKSTMDPSAFQESVKLIGKYSDRQSSVSILSEYDTILLFLADRFSAMPHFEVGRFLNGPEHSQLVVDDIKKRRPATLIVDSCIRCSTAPYRVARPVPGLDPAYTSRALEKIDRLQRLRDVFAEVEADYTLVATGPLVSVWQRK